MDAIDITNADFFLGNTPTNLNISENIIEKLNIPMYGWIGLVIIICIIVWLIYNNNTKKNKVTFQDKLDTCYEDTCYEDTCKR